MPRRKRTQRQMMLPLDGYAPLGTHRRHPPAQKVRTSIAAAEAIAEAAPTLRGRVYQGLVDAGFDGATREELAARLGMRLQTVCGRCRELVEQGLIYDSGTTRTTESGRQAVVLKVRRV